MRTTSQPQWCSEVATVSFAEMEKLRCYGGRALRRPLQGPAGPPMWWKEESNFHVLSFDLFHMCSVTSTCCYTQIHSTEGWVGGEHSLTKRRREGKKKELI